MIFLSITLFKNQIGLTIRITQLKIFNKYLNLLKYKKSNIQKKFKIIYIIYKVQQ